MKVKTQEDDLKWSAVELTASEGKSWLSSDFG